jgi:hypothetical protein
VERNHIGILDAHFSEADLVKRSFIATAIPAPLGGITNTFFKPLLSANLKA